VISNDLPPTAPRRSKRHQASLDGMQTGQSKEPTTPLSLLPPASWIPWATGLEMDKSCDQTHLSKEYYWDGRNKN
jgi:hypothetical protein